MENSMGSFKELYDVYLKATYPIEIEGKTIEVGETVAYFDKIQVAGLHELKEFKSANGGFDNRGHVFWESTKELQLSFAQGVFSKVQFAMMSNSRLLQKAKGDIVLVTKTEQKESGKDGSFELSETPAQNLFIYNASNREKITSYELEGNKITLNEPFQDVVVQYQYNYDNGGRVMKIGQRLIAGYLEFEGKTRVKDDTTGHEITGLIKIPKLKLMSELSIRLGAQANPVVGSFAAVGVPTGTRGNSYVSEFYFLNNDIDSDF